jgi:hypothetical protein
MSPRRRASACAGRRARPPLPSVPTTAVSSAPKVAHRRRGVPVEARPVVAAPRARGQAYSPTSPCSWANTARWGGG